ncbi:MAG: hypothetical protein ACKVS8_09485 [Phycisphaerales bacterium]
MTTRLTTSALAAALGLMSLAGPMACNSSNTTSTPTTLTREQKAEQAKAAFLAADPGLKRFFDSAAGYVVFPSVGKGGFIITVAGGDGVMYNKAGNVLGYASMSSVKAGAAVGGQGFKELIFLKEPADISRFQSGGVEFDASASAVIAKSGASASNDYRNGVAVFITGETGAMLDASIGGQGFKFYPR